MAWFLDKLREGKLLTATEVADTVGFTNVVGVTINGRKAIAGPVCAVSVIIEPHSKFQYTELAKNLSEEECGRVANDIKLRAAFLSIGWGVTEDFERDSDYPVLKALSSCLTEFSVYHPATTIFSCGGAGAGRVGQV